MLKKTVNKLWLGKFVSIRDYELATAIKSGGLELQHDGQKMLLSVEQLNSITPSGAFHKSKFGGADYQLADITFKPLTEDPNQSNLI